MKGLVFSDLLKSGFSATRQLFSLVEMANSAPFEVLDQIFCQLPLPTLKTAALVCQSFRYAVDKFIFREVLLLPNAESFDKLRQISNHSRLRYFVKNVVYSGKMLPRYQKHKDWCSHLKRGTSEPVDDDHEYTKKMDSQQFNEKGLEQQYERYCFCVKSEERVLSNNNARHWMNEAFSLMPSLTSVTLDKRHSVKPVAKSARESLVEPTVWSGQLYYPQQFGDLVRAAHASGVVLNRLDGLGICWSGFEDYSECLGQIAQGLSHLSLMFRQKMAISKKESDMLREVVKSASGLQTFEISFTSLLNHHTDRSVPLSDFLPSCKNWSSLKRLKLEAIITSQLALMDLLSCHATTLRSLELSDIEIDVVTEGGTMIGSWTNMIHFLQENLSLTDVSLHGSLCITWGEGWWVNTEQSWRFANNHRHDVKLPPLEETLKFKVEQYILEGGTCPLDLPKNGDYLYLEDYLWWIEDYSWNMSDN